MSRLLNFHQMLVRDQHRMEQYRQAIYFAVRPNDVVLDVGTGSGILALFACLAGAKRVYAVERSNAMVLARQLAKANRFDDRIIFIQDDVHHISLPEPVDVITSELISKAVIGQKMADTIGFCRDRWLKKNGRIVPERVALCIAPVQAQTVYEQLAYPEEHLYGLDFTAASQLKVHHPASFKMPPESLLATSQTAYTYRAYQSPPNERICSTQRFDIDTPCTLHGYCAWFEATLYDQVLLDNKPPGIASWDNLFFPLLQPVSLMGGTQIVLQLDGTDAVMAEPQWAWHTTIKQAGETIANYRQSTLQGTLLTANYWRKRTPKHIPQLNISGKIDKFIINAMESNLSLEMMAHRLTHQYPEQFTTVEEALIRVANLSERYSE